MVKVETRKFVEENRQLVEFVAKHGSSEVRKIAKALLLAVDLERRGEEARGCSVSNQNFAKSQ